MNPPLMSGFFAAAALFCGETTFAQSVDKEPVAIVELGGAAGWNLKDGSSSFGFGFDFAAEVTPIENWLELEIGTTPLFSRRSKEWDTDVLFKKPLDALKKSGAYVRHWPGMDSYERTRQRHQLGRG